MATTELFVKMVLDRWNGSILNFNKQLGALTDEKILEEIRPGKNRGIYLLGHMVAVHDDMLVLLNLGDKLFPGLHEPFLKLADKATTAIPSLTELRNYWQQQCDSIQEKFEKVNPEQWFEKHTAISEEDFAKEPHRNKLNVIITRTSHLQYHTGQLALLN